MLRILFPLATVLYGAYWLLVTFHSIALPALLDGRVSSAIVYVWDSFLWSLDPSNIKDWLGEDEQSAKERLIERKYLRERLNK